MKTKLILTTLLSFAFYLLSSQIPQGFNYQAIVRNNMGEVLQNKGLKVTIAIKTALTGGIVLWEEYHNVTSNQFGLVSFAVGSGIRASGTIISFGKIDWKAQPLYLNTKVEYPAGTTTDMGTARILSVPYSLVAKNVEGPIDKLGIKGTESSVDSVLFDVKNKNGQTVFAVYPEGVRVYVADGAKGTKGGFAVGSFGTGKAESQNYMMVSKDSIRMYIDTNPLTKAKKGGFAVGGYDLAKSGTTNFFNVATDTSDKIIPSQNRILWYPQKNAFLTGKVLIEHPDSVGVNSFSTGFESKAIGDWSQALGFRTTARGNYSTSIGKNSYAKGENSFAFGNKAKTIGDDSYAFGTGAKATGPKSFAMGSSQLNDSTGTMVQTVASAEGAFALGFGSVASDLGAFAIGVLDTASGPLSLAMGYYTKSQSAFSTTLGAGTIVEPAGWNGLATGILTRAGNWAACSFGDRSYASGHTSFATGYSTLASGHLSATFGSMSTASGSGSIAMGDNTVAQSYASLVLGRYNVISGTPTIWYSWEPIFVIGNGTSSGSRSNAMTVYKSGVADFGSYINLNRTSTGGAIYVNNSEALWFNGTTFSWGFDGTYNVFGDHVSVGTTGTSSAYELYVAGSVYATGGWAGSDARWKKDLEPIQNIIPEVAKLQGLKYNWRTDEYPDMNFDKGRQIGLIAQDVEKVFPELVKTDDKGYKAMSYEKLSVILLEAVKEQQLQIESTKQENQQLKSELQSLRDEMDQIKIILAKRGSE